MFGARPTSYDATSSGPTPCAAPVEAPPLMPCTPLTPSAFLRMPNKSTRLPRSSEDAPNPRPYLQGRKSQPPHTAPPISKPTNARMGFLPAATGRSEEIRSCCPSAITSMNQGVGAGQGRERQRQRRHCQQRGASSDHGMSPNIDLRTRTKSPKLISQDFRGIFVKSE